MTRYLVSLRGKIGGILSKHSAGRVNRVRVSRVMVVGLVVLGCHVFR